MTEEEAQEVLHTAMTVGATRMQVMLTQEAAKLDGSQGGPLAETAEPARRPPVADRAAPTFAAAEVVEQAGGG